MHCGHLDLPTVCNAEKKMLDSASCNSKEAFLATSQEETIVSKDPINDVSYGQCIDKFVNVQDVTDPDYDRLLFQLNFHHFSGSIHVCHFDRKKSERLSSTLERIKVRLLKLKTKKRKLVSCDIREMRISLLDIFGHVVNENMDNGATWDDGFVLKIGEDNYMVRRNFPTITDVNLLQPLMPGFLYELSINGNFFDKLRIEWKRKTGEQDWSIVSKSGDYIVQSADAGTYFCVMVTPQRGDIIGNTFSYHVPNVVIDGPFPCPYQQRQEQHTASRLKWPDFRVMSYNMLADLYADSDYSRQTLFPSCPNYALNFDYRKQLLLQEIPGYHADIVCLQECDRKFFRHELDACMNKNGYMGTFKGKLGDGAEGEAIFYKRDRFRLISTHDFHPMESLLNCAQFADVLAAVQEIDPLYQKLITIKSILQIQLLEDVIAGNRTLVATTHFYFHPEAGNIRLILAELCLRHLAELRQQLAAGGEKPAVVFAGDFNSNPRSGVVQLITNGKLERDHADWGSAGEDFKVCSLEFKDGSRMKSACGFPAYTNYVASFQECIDYIFVNGVDVTGSVPMPSHEDVVRNTALPSICFPSDHLPIIASLRWSSDVGMTSAEN